MAETKTTKKRTPKAKAVPQVVEEVPAVEEKPEEKPFMSRRALRREKLREMFGITK